MGNRQENSNISRGVLVVVPTLNEEHSIEACLTSLLADEAAFSRLPAQGGALIVLADGGSQDQTREIVQAMAQKHMGRLLLMHNPDKLQSAGINHAVERYGKGRDTLVRCDAHCTYPERYVSRLVKTLRSQDQLASVVVPMDAFGHSAFARAAALIVDTPLGSGGAAHRGGTRSGFVDHGHHAAMDLDYFQSVGGYDPSFATNEDSELDYRLRQAGGRIWLDGTIRLGYAMRESPRTLARQYYRYGSGRASTILKHRIRPRLRQLAPVVNLLLLVLSVACAAISPFALLWPVLYAALIAGASLWGAAKLGLAGAWAGPALAIMHISWGAGFLARLVRGRRLSASGTQHTQPSAESLPVQISTKLRS